MLKEADPQIEKKLHHYVQKKTRSKYRVYPESEDWLEVYNSPIHIKGDHTKTRWLDIKKTETLPDFGTSDLPLEAWRDLTAAHEAAGLTHRETHVLVPNGYFLQPTVKGDDSYEYVFYPGVRATPDLESFQKLKQDTDNEVQELRKKRVTNVLSLTEDLSKAFNFLNNAGYTLKSDFLDLGHFVYSETGGLFIADFSQVVKDKRSTNEVLFFFAFIIELLSGKTIDDDLENQGAISSSLLAVSSTLPEDFLDFMFKSIARSLENPDNWSYSQFTNELRSVLSEQI